VGCNFTGSVDSKPRVVALAQVSCVPAGSSFTSDVDRSKPRVLALALMCCVPCR
jgi:hypothetical protein